ncbi:MAG: bifunctional diaminohydroxyphosphoribosylaminopyrimidine deaminase/5-amino-6-(5-phosphoribosylamino)uracil reductase RibD [Bacteroidota bacterium]|nr:bifunctional diaminohydroxyphosphoribosylaminopyrimidine deaminase/5-amino-6-(5-phosphoribosylamino)uracil reductase RibD [Bacteroidota bacterium]
MEKHEKYMQRCLQLAKNGLGNTYPNPLVGSVIVHNNKIIGEGFHTKAGENHAEINAINSVKNKSLLKSSTIYVNLEPCSHYGKTPPCAKKIADLKIPRVVIGTLDTNIKVAGRGVKILNNAGTKVITHVLKNESREINKRFFTFHEKQRPYIILKWAQSADGFIDPIRSSDTPIAPYWITGKHERQLVHKWRTEEQAILVGKNTVLKDNPMLTSRNWNGNNPIRIVIDRYLSISHELNIFNNSAKTIIFNYLENSTSEIQEYIKIKKTKNELEQILSILHKKNILSVIIEGGAKTHQSFIDNNYFDEAKIFVGNTFFKAGTKAAKIDFLKQKEITNFENSKLFLF